jgi:hypothetical protein
MPSLSFRLLQLVGLSPDRGEVHARVGRHSDQQCRLHAKAMSNFARIEKGANQSITNQYNMNFGVLIAWWRAHLLDAMQ